MINVSSWAWYLLIVLVIIFFLAGVAAFFGGRNIGQNEGYAQMKIECDRILAQTNQNWQTTMTNEIKRLNTDWQNRLNTEISRLNTDWQNRLSTEKSSSYNEGHQIGRSKGYSEGHAAGLTACHQEYRNALWHCWNCWSNWYQHHKQPGWPDPPRCGCWCYPNYPHECWCP